MLTSTTSRSRRCRHPDRRAVCASVAPCVEALEVRQLLSAAAVPATNAGGAPNAPFALQVVANGTNADLFSFVDSADNETGFVVSRSVNGGAFAKLATLAPSTAHFATVTFTDSNLAPGSSYSYTVAAVNGPYSSSTPNPVTYNNVTNTPTPTPTPTPNPNPGGAPNAPFGLSATPDVSTGAVAVSFYDSATNETGFAVERSTSPSGPFTQVAVLPPSVSSGAKVTYEDKSVTPTAIYYYTVVALNGPYSSSTPAPVEAEAPGMPGTALNAPYGVAATATSPTSVTVSFYNDDSNATSFLISRYDQPNGNGHLAVFQVYQTAAVGQQVSYTDTTAQPGQTYYYYVDARNGNTASAEAGPAVATTPSTPTVGHQLRLDTTFGNGGDVIDSRAPGAQLLALSPNGQTVYAVNVDIGNPGPTLFAYAASNGAPSTTLAGGGEIFLNASLSNPFTTVSAMAVQADGKVVVAGNSNRGMTVARYNADGTLDASFGNAGGELVVDYGGGEAPGAVGIAANGQIYVGGVHDVYQSTTQEFFAVRLNADGSIDRSYGYNGISKGDQHGGVRVAGLAIDPTDGSVILAGSSYDGSGKTSVSAIAGTRLLASGNAVDSFSTAQVTGGAPGLITGSEGSGIALQPDGKFVIVGDENGDAVTARFNANGTLDPSWVGPGAITPAGSGFSSFFDGIAILPDGSFVATGTRRPNPSVPFASQAMIVHLRANGTIDPTAGDPSGVVFRTIQDAQGNVDSAYGHVVVAPDGSVFTDGTNGSLLVSKFKLV